MHVPIVDRDSDNRFSELYRARDNDITIVLIEKSIRSDPGKYQSTHATSASYLEAT